MGDYRHSSIDFSILEFKDNGTKREQIERLFAKCLKIPFVRVNPSLNSKPSKSNTRNELSSKNELNNDDDEITIFYGTLGFEKLADGVKCLIKNFCNNYQCRRKLLNFDESILFSEILSYDILKVSHEIAVTSFSMGTLINLTDFCDHYNSDYEMGYVDEDGVEKEVLQVATNDMYALFHHSKNEINFHFRMVTIPNLKTKRTPTKINRYKMIIKYSSIKNIILKREDYKVIAYLMLENPPSIYALKRDLLSTTVTTQEQETNRDIHAGEKWLRQIKFLGLNTAEFGKCSTLKLNLFNHENPESLPPHKQPISPWTILNAIGKFQKFGCYFGNVKDKHLQYPPRPIKLNDLPPRVSFRITFALRALESISFQFADDLIQNHTENHKDELMKLALKDAEAFENSLYELFDAIAGGAFVQSLPFIKRKFIKLKDSPRSDPVFKSSGIVKIRRAVLTPTRLILLRPHPFLESRFIRNCDTDYVLRLSLRDDDMTFLTFSLYGQLEQEKKRFLMKCVKLPLLKGIPIADRTYEFVGSSQSQLRDNGLYLYAKDLGGKTAAQIRDKLGQINEKNVSKYVARVGLLLSQAQIFIPVTQAEIKLDEPDIMHEESVHPDSKDRYKFSDGAGMVSQEFAEKITGRLKEYKLLPESARIPSAFQIRLGGCKGLLVTWPNLKEIRKDLLPYDIVIRDSMRKFESDDRMLGILKVSDVRNVYLNKPLITVLDQLGVDTNVFLTMQLDVLNDILHCFLSEQSAANILRQYSSLHSHVKYDNLIASGIHILNEPFFRLLLDNVIRHATFLLKTKGRIQIPLSQGRTMFGVVDETMTLKYGEVFIQASSKENSNKTEIWTGKVLVSKFPCLHPGDARTFTAVDNEKLHHIRDCIVFPGVGPRPHPNEMAGSDLDGDEYAVIRYEPLFPPRIHAPMQYPDTKPKKDEINLETILDFYVDFIEEYSVGVIAKAHLAWADRLEKGIFHEKCMKLAEMYSVSLDFAKTGKNCKLEDEDKVRIYPDFMEKFSQKSTYLSRRALGALFRQITVFQLIFDEQLPIVVQDNENRLFEHPQSQKFIEVAKEAYKEYAHSTHLLQKMFKIKTESELVSGIYNKEDKFMSGKEEAGDSQRMIIKLMRQTVQNLRQFFDEQIARYSNDSKEVEELKLAQVSAYYKVTRELNAKTTSPIYGLPWIFSDYMAKLAQKNRTLSPIFPDEDSKLKYFGKLIDDQLNISTDETSLCDDEKQEECLKRIEMVRKIVIYWLDRQTHLKLGLCNSKHYAISEVDKIVNVSSLKYHQNYNNLPSPGLMIIEVFQRLLNAELSPQFQANADDTKQFRFTVGFSSLMTLYRLYKMHKVDHILPEPRINLSTAANLLDVRSFRLELPINSNLYNYVKECETSFCKSLKVLTGSALVTGDWIERNPNSWYYEVLAIANRPSLYSLSFFLSKLLTARGVNMKEVIENAVNDNSFIKK
ncbi:RNA-dependent RNA polymerase 1-like protein [Dinothrombium tinctorium]|uniref:RNA-dependent RNA polymerase n=1 Tax=Dinothrombium tinctorium TaxID=1965070 RepID=A0A3S3NSJ9_9ACAR|nr:RNA-dependent RNA polymerase 1-like protein [Dinothrombium tinctorium]RWS08426.1 RNA-dependent RNA polymerase 1-like protein [Dinothrombium tinctorium]